MSENDFKTLFCNKIKKCFSLRNYARGRPSLTESYKNNLVYFNMIKGSSNCIISFYYKFKILA